MYHSFGKLTTNNYVNFIYLRVSIILKNTSETFQRTFYLILAYGLGFGLGYVTRITGNPKIAIEFYVSEQEIFAVYQLSLKDVLDIILIGPIFTLLSFIVLKKLLDSLKDQNFEEKSIMVSYFIFLIAIVILRMFFLIN